MRKKDKELVEKFQIEEDKRRNMPQEVHNKINEQIMANLIIAILMMFFYVLLIFGYRNIEPSVYQKDLKVFSLLYSVIAIILWEYSYKKESGKMCIYGIEVAVLSIITLFSTYMSILQGEKYVYYLALCSYFSAIYYNLKDIRIYKKMKKEYLKSLSDIDEIIKKEKAERKEETERKRR